MIGVVPILPTLTTMALLLPALLLSILAALAALRRPDVAKRILPLVWRQKYALLVLAVCAVTICWLDSRWPRQVANDQRGGLSAGGSWPMDRGDLQRRGWVPGEPGPVGGSLRWSSGRSGEAFWSSPAVVGNRVYCVSSRGDRGLICCWDAETGEQQWSAAPARYRATFSSPVISGRYLLCGEGLHHARRGRVVCLDLQSPQAGRVCWTFTTNGHVECTPVIAANRVYVGAGDDGVYCLRLDPSARDQDRVVWHAPGTRYPDAETSLAVWRDRVYVGLGQGGSALCVLDAATGTELARRSMPDPVFSPPAIADGQLIVGMGRGDFVRPVDDPVGSLRCFDLATFQEQWSFALPATVLGAVAVTEDRVVAACCDGHVYLLDRAGRLLQQWNSGAPIVAAPAVTDRLIYVVNQDGLLVALDARSLQCVWEARLGPAGRYFSAPVVAAGHVYVGTPEDGLQCRGDAPTRADDELWPGEGGGAGAAGSRDDSSIPREAQVRWQFDRLAPDASPLAVTAGVAIADATIVVPFQAGAEGGLVALAAGDVAQVRPLWVHPLPAGVRDSPAISGGRVFAVTADVGGSPRHLLALDLTTGKELWRRAWQVSETSLTASGDRLLVQESPGRLRGLDLDGSVLWTAEIGPLRHGVDASTSLLVAAVERPPALVAIDAVSGRLLWTSSLPRPAATPPAVCGKRIYFADAAGVQIHSLIDGQPLAQLEGVVSGPLSVAPDRIAFISGGGELVLGDPSGCELARLSGATPGLNPLIGFNGVLFSAANAIMAADLPGRTVRTFAELGHVQITAQPVLHAGRVYVGLAGRGLVCLTGGDEP